ncbi:MAG: hypothetical protein K0U86_10380 [Planctomycetes bacterium]|nr:hypothetical protein [Planctomycetota bacterium]MCH9725297.1 hypothetical protein [Planctomycetota bacterium]MCH9779483.1 hypothetical protein [Planctomycetota bacterium]MCH9793208.1 hypothetical protein [Planctomycetota bacterium]
MNISFGDNVKILAVPETDALGLSGKQGQVYGETTPSVSSIEVIGELTEDYAINVSIEGFDETFWLAPHLLELIDHGQGTTMEIGHRKAVRRADGTWEESEMTRPKPWWKFW